MELPLKKTQSHAHAAVRADLRTAGPAPRAVTVAQLAPSSGWRALGLRDVWEYRELIYFLVWRDVKVRYKQTAFGAAWAIIQPVSTMVVFSLFFGRLAKMPSDGVPYPVFSLAALVPWTFFAAALTQSANSLVANQHLLTKVYFPRLVVPTAAVLAGLVDFAVAFVVLAAMVAYFRIVPTAAVLWLPFFLLLALATALGAGLWLAALNVAYRDVRYVLPFLVQVWLFVTPVAYPSSLLGEPWRTLYGLNPMAGVVDGFRWALLGTAAVPRAMIAISTGAAAALLVGGAFYFRRTERSFADLA
jgi:lipopolysaccharide transport system permease protein